MSGKAKRTADKGSSSRRAKRPRQSQEAPRSKKSASSEPKQQTPKLPKFPFVLPSYFAEDPDRFELWTFRVPTSVPLEDMEGCVVSTQSGKEVESEKIRFTSSQNRADDSRNIATSSSTSNSTTFALRHGNSTENESLRLLVPHSQLENRQIERDGEEPESETKRLVPLDTFARHINVLEHFAVRTERELAPSKDQAPSAGGVLKLAYTHVPQKKGLKRRWQPRGSESLPAERLEKAVAASTLRRNFQRGTSSSHKLAVKGTTANDNNEFASSRPSAAPIGAPPLTKKQDTSPPGTDDKATKKARKKEKKAKKDAKKARKEEKKIKRES